MNNKLRLEKTEGTFKNGQSRDTVNTGHRTEWTIQRHCQHWAQDRMDNLETLSTLGTGQNGQSRDTVNTGYRTEWTI